MGSRVRVQPPRAVLAVVFARRRKGKPFRFLFQDLRDRVGEFGAETPGSRLASFPVAEDLRVRALDLDQHRIVGKSGKEIDDRSVSIVGSATAHRHLAIEGTHHPVVEPATEDPSLALEEHLSIAFRPCAVAKQLLERLKRRPPSQ